MSPELETVFSALRLMTPLQRIRWHDHTLLMIWFAHAIGLGRSIRLTPSDEPSAPSA